MNKNFKRKLIVSGLTLGVAAFATTATTYAWFTSNTTVKTNEVTGTVEDNSSIYVKTGSGNFGTSVDIETSKLTFSPVQTSNGKKFTKLSGEATKNVDYLEFELEFMTESSTLQTIYLTDVTFKNTTVNKDFTLKADAAAESDGLKKGATAQIDVLDALVLSIQDTTSGDTTSATSYKYSQDKTWVGSTVGKYDGLYYYNQIMDIDQTRPEDYANRFDKTTYLNSVNSTRNGNITLGTVQGETHLKVTFRLYLDGWDQECFDAITSQTFKAAFTFSVNENNPAA